MALQPKYEGLIDGTKNALAAEIASAAAEIVPGRICCIASDAGAGYVQCASTLVPATDKPYGLIADYKADVIASGKVTVYLDGVFHTDQISGTPAKGDLLSFTATGLIKTAGSGEYVVGICVEAAGGDGMLEMKLNIAGFKAP